jgi:hypothetical protein
MDPSRSLKASLYFSLDARYPSEPSADGTNVHMTRMTIKRKISKIFWKCSSIQFWKLKGKGNTNDLLQFNVRVLVPQ